MKIKNENSTLCEQNYQIKIQAYFDSISFLNLSRYCCINYEHDHKYEKIKIK